MNDDSPVDRPIRADIDLLDRFAQAVAHDLRNIVLPESNDAGSSSAPSPDRMRRHVSDLVEHVQEIAAAMDMWRDHERLRNTPCTIEHWWRLQARLFAALFEKRPQMRIAPHVDESQTVDAGQLSKAVAHVCSLLAGQLQECSSIVFEFHQGQGGAMDVHMNIDPPWRADEIQTTLVDSQTAAALGIRLKRQDPGCLEIELQKRSQD